MTKDDSVAVILKILQHVTVFQIFDQGTGRNQDHCGFSTFAAAKCPKAVLTAFCVPVSMANEVAQGTLIGISLENNVAAFAAVATIGATARDKHFTTKTAAAVAAIASATIQNDSIGKHGHDFRGQYRELFRTWIVAFSRSLWLSFRVESWPFSV
jgi:hypothetical protein